MMKGCWTLKKINAIYIYMRSAVVHDNIFPQQFMFLMHLFDLISNSHSLYLHPLDVTVETICQETKSSKDAWHTMTHFRVLTVNLNQLMNQITPALFWEIYDVLLCMIRQESEETRFFNVTFS